MKANIITNITNNEKEQSCAFAERFVRSVKEECTNHFIFISQRHVERVLREYFAFYKNERPHQGRDIGGELLIPAQERAALKARAGPI